MVNNNSTKFVLAGQNQIHWTIISIEWGGTIKDFVLIKLKILVLLNHLKDH